MDEQRTEIEFDTKLFMSDLRLKTDSKDHTSLRDIAADVGASAATLSRIDRGQVPDMETFMRICSNLKLSPSSYFRTVIWRKVTE